MRRQRLNCSVRKQKIQRQRERIEVDDPVDGDVVDDEWCGHRQKSASKRPKPSILSLMSLARSACQ